MTPVSNISQHDVAISITVSESESVIPILEVVIKQSPQNIVV